MKQGKHFNLYFQRLRHKVFRNYFGTVTHYEINRKVAAITFDNGTSPDLHSNSTKVIARI
jgi:hypothetical protein